MTRDVKRRGMFQGLGGTPPHAHAAPPHPSAPGSADALPHAPPAARSPLAVLGAGSAPVARRFGEAVAEMEDRANRAEELESLLASGEQIVEIDPDAIDPSPIRDRMDGDPAEEESLRQSIAETGQQIPVMLRPSEEEGRYVTIFGHRRIDAARALGRPVRAIVKAMSEEEAFVAQGVENAERRDLTFIERALFAQKLYNSGLTQQKVGMALAAPRNMITMMQTITRAVPSEIILAIGRAPDVGRPRWEELGKAFSSAGTKGVTIARAAVADFDRSLDATARIARLLAALKEKPAAAQTTSSRPDHPVDSGFASISSNRRGDVRLVLKGGDDPSFRSDKAPFGKWLTERLGALHEAWRRGE